MMNMSVIAEATKIVCDWFEVESINITYDEILEKAGQIYEFATVDYEMKVSDAKTLAAVVIDALNEGIPVTQIEYTEENFVGLRDFYFWFDNTAEMESNINVEELKEVL